MKRVFRFAILLAGLSLVAGSSVCIAAAQASDSQINPERYMTPKQQAHLAPHTGPAMERMDAPETNHQQEEYLHSKAVKWIAAHLHISTDAAADIFEDFNSGILIFFIAYFLWKKLPGVFRKRSEDLQKELVEARKETEESEKRLRAIEARLAHLDAEIEEFRARSERDAIEEEKRMHASIETERQRIVASAEQEIEAASGAAQRDLKRFAGELAIAQARSRLRVSADADKGLIAEFAQSLARDRNGGSHG